MNNVKRSIFPTSVTLLYLKMLLYHFQNKQFLILAQGVFDKQAFLIIHYFLGKQLPCLCIYSTTYILETKEKIPFETYNLVEKVMVRVL